MCDFNNLDDAQKTAYHNKLSECAKAFGGANFFLQLLEEIRKTKPHPLVSKYNEFKFPKGGIFWNKTIFQDKLSLLLKVRIKENLLPDSSDKNFKKTLNLLKTLHPISFEVRPKSSKDGDGFVVKPFKIIDDKTTHINPVFDALFFCSVDTVKKILAYEPK
jgi:hypothetical protein